jgi:pimeloyl-ACP methyl ester carboxylesterase
VIVDIGPETIPAGSARIQAGTQAQDVFDDPEEAFRQARAANPRPPEAEQRHRILNNLMQRPDGKWTWRYDVALRSPDRPRRRPEPAEGWALMPRITCPTLLIRGAESDILSRETAERMAREIPNCRLVEVPDAGHSVPLDSPMRFQEAVKGFL